MTSSQDAVSRLNRQSPDLNTITTQEEKEVSLVRALTSADMELTQVLDSQLQWSNRAAWGEKK